MLLINKKISPNNHVLIVLGSKGHPTFKTIHLDVSYLEKLGAQLLGLKKTRYVSYQVVSSSNVFTLTHPDYLLDKALDEIIRNLLLKPNTHLYS